MNMKWYKLYRESYEDIQAANDKYEWEMRQYPQQRKLKDFIGNELDKIYNKVRSYYIKKLGEEKGEKLMSKLMDRFEKIEDDLMKFIDVH